MSHFQISEDLKALFLQRLEESITQGDTITYVKSRKSVTTVRNGEGEVIRTQETISEERNTTLIKTTKFRGNNRHYAHVCKNGRPQHAYLSGGCERTGGNIQEAPKTG